jgi:putative hydrolase of the HAD superfamily
MPKSKLKAIIFDADGVVINPKMQFAKYLDEKLGITREITACFFNRDFQKCLAGQKDLKKCLAPFVKKWKFQGSVDDFVKIWLKKDDQIDFKLLAEIEKLKKLGYKCYLATNQEKNRALYMKNKKEFQETFDKLFFSCDLKTVKPQKDYYLKIEEDLKKIDPGIKSNQILFFDDSYAHVNMAKKVGWKAYFYSNLENFKKDIRRLIPDFL